MRTHTVSHDHARAYCRKEHSNIELSLYLLILNNGAGCWLCV